MNPVTVGQNIRALRIREGMTLEQLASVLNIRKNMLSNYELGKNSISAELLTKIADYFNVSLDRLAERQTTSVRETNIKMKHCPIYSYIYSDDIYSDINNREILYYISVPEVQLSKGDYFGLKITDDLLDLKAFYRGSIAITHVQSVARDGDFVIYISGDSKASYGQYSQHEDTVLISPKSSNPQHKPIMFDLKTDSFKILGKIVMLFGPISDITY